MAASGDGKQIMDKVNDATIRLFDIPNSAAEVPQTRGEGSWKVCNAKVSGGLVQWDIFLERSSIRI